MDKHDRRVLDHFEHFGTLEVGGSGGPGCRVVALLDLAAELDKVKAEYEMVVGDWNVRHSEGGSSKNTPGGRSTTVVRRFALSTGLVEPLKKRLGWGEADPRTYGSGGNES